MVLLDAKTLFWIKLRASCVPDPREHAENCLQKGCELDAHVSTCTRACMAVYLSMRQIDGWSLFAFQRKDHTNRWSHGLGFDRLVLIYVYTFILYFIFGLPRKLLLCV